LRLLPFCGWLQVVPTVIKRVPVLVVYLHAARERKKYLVHINMKVLPILLTCASSGIITPYSIRVS
jgi:hypothetical protein